MGNKVEITGVNTSTLPKLNGKQMSELMIRIKNGDKLARDEFAYANMRLVLSVVQRFNAPKENMDDIFQVGCIGLMKAIDNFDVGLNVKFSTYAVPMIVGEIKRFLRDNNSVRVSRSLRDIAYRALKAREELSKDRVEEPTIEEIAELIDVKVKDVAIALDAISTPISLGDPVYNDGDDTIYLMDQVSDSKNSEEIWLENINLKIETVIRGSIYPYFSVLEFMELLNVFDKNPYSRFHLNVIECESCVAQRSLLENYCFPICHFICTYSS